ncbi:MAG: hypothetical protein KME60_28070 [Cyanomargarita calcarea GSE-NOS-MK-12-04C]|jgi:hypothetical protein|uniref:Uncharacterized protein n=1 Tax=Cyanomargarita calcarea GSE-NOS-MK-12-04C TaxID=2839659 RepID=A0A951UYR6_9CYAN|nr:hypothetical protein [Cyanomargarita calcarea GSE-NOS-MK-12-04C]
MDLYCGLSGGHMDLYCGVVWRTHGLVLWGCLADTWTCIVGLSGGHMDLYCGLSGGHMDLYCGLSGGHMDLYCGVVWRTHGLVLWVVWRTHGLVLWGCLPDTWTCIAGCLADTWTCIAGLSGGHMDYYIQFATPVKLCNNPDAIAPCAYAKRLWFVEQDPSRVRGIKRNFIQNRYKS